MVVGIIIQNWEGELLLQQRDDFAPTFKRHWTLFGGVVEENETSFAAALRELEEEISLTAAHIDLFEVARTYQQSNGTVQIIFHLLTRVTVDLLQLAEGREMKFFKRSEVPALHFAFNIEQVLEDFLAGSAGSPEFEHARSLLSAAAPVDQEL